MDLELVEAIVSTTSWSLDITKDTLDVTAHGATSRANVGGLISGSGSIDFLYTAASGNETANLSSRCINNRRCW